MGVHLSVENAINFYIIAAGIGVCGMCFLNIMRAPIRNLFRKLILAFLWMMALIQYTAVPEGRGGIVLRAVQVYSAVHILLLPLAAIVAQALYSDIKFIMIATVVASVYMFVAFTNSLTEKYEKQQRESSRIETKLSMAKRIQSDMLPNIFPAFPDRKEFDIYASMNPAKEVGGDFFDFFLIDDDHLGIVMADVSGKGVPAALFMMASKIVIQNCTIMNKDPKTALEAANNHICQNNREEMFVTVWLGILKISTGILRAVNAGHEYPILKKPGGEYTVYKDRHLFKCGLNKRGAGT